MSVLKIPGVGIANFLWKGLPISWIPIMIKIGGLALILQGQPLIGGSLFLSPPYTKGGLSPSRQIPFHQYGDGFEDETIILYQLPYSNAYLRMIVYDSAGREIAALTDGSVFINECTIRWNGETDRDYTCRMGQYLLYVEAADRLTGQSWKTIERIIEAKK